ncbi:SPOR domain-containing protein [Pseudomonas citronellolis]|uniref:SPOR domain-containing protein n=1 Tax=Pseudomonas citronellolis TaxID=53408 RepID=UPI0023E35F3B|nr:SPOR domain-containing protein [Pseudomonas citronellolis]MDF3934646.1 SPOR domain-containing protein [Pseudomonas citronellolis]
MALLDKGLKQRIVGALVLLALAVIFLPMLFSRQDEVRQVTVDAPAMPKTPAMPQVAVQPTAVPQPQAPAVEAEPPQALEQAELPVPSAPASAPAAPIASLPQAAPQAPAPAPQPVAPQRQAAPVQQQAATPPAQPSAPAQRLDADNLAVSWSVQLASLSNRARAEELQKTLRSQGYNAYVRSFDGMNRVFVGPVVERGEADRLKEQLSKQQKLNGFVVRFQPERG